MLIGSSETMGTGVNVQQRLVALHHLDVPWLPSHIEQREGRIERQGNQNEEIGLYAYATLGSMDATMWQNNERKARFIAAALSGDRSIRRIEDIGSQANQFAMAKAIASGDSRLIQKAGLQAEIARLSRQRAAHFDSQHDIRRRIQDAEHDPRPRGTADRRAAPGPRPAHRHPRRRVHHDDRRQAARRPGAPPAPRCCPRPGWPRWSATLEPWILGRIGGFDLECRVEPGMRDMRLAARLVLVRTDFEQDVEMEGDLTPLGLIARLEHLLGRFEGDLAEHGRRRDLAAASLAEYQPKLGEPFALQGELEEKLARMASLEADLAGTGRKPPGDPPEEQKGSKAA